MAGQIAGSFEVSKDIEEALQRFLEATEFGKHGGVVTDLDGTVVHEDQGRIYIPQPVELALKELYRLGRQLLVNTLRFPLSALRSFGRDWYSISNAPIPLVALNGSQFGFIESTASGELTFSEQGAQPMRAADIAAALEGAERLLAKGIKDLLIFYYPRDWKMGETIWTPIPESIDEVKSKYVSASSVTAIDFGKLRETLHANEICMIFLLIDLPQDTLMAYQHSRRGNFYTRAGVDKLSGTKQFGEYLGIDLSHSVGAGDTLMDTFLSAMGMAMIVGNNGAQFTGIHETVRLRDSLELGAALGRLVELERRIARS